MKKYAYFPLALALAGLLTGCYSTQSSRTAQTSRDHDTIIQITGPATTLANLLARAPGVYVDDLGLSTNVRIRGGTPLFVVDGIRLGHSYAAAASAVDVNSITGIEILKDPSETLIYGRDAQFGVVVIHTGNFDPADNQ